MNRLRPVGGVQVGPAGTVDAVADAGAEQERGDGEEGEEEDGEVVILKLEDTDEDSDEESYVGVEDEEILNKVFEIFKEKYKDEFNFVDED